MSDIESDKYITIEKDEQIDESFAKITESLEYTTPIRGRGKKGPANSTRSARQKYCERWELEFPWLKADKIDESLGICLVCDVRLVCKKSHLERHQNSYKHQRLSAFEPDIVPAKPDNPFAVFLDNDEEKHDSDEFELEHLESEDFSSTAKTPLKKIKKESFKSKNSSASISMVKRPVERPKIQRAPKEQKVKLNRLKLLNRIHRDRNELNEYYYTRQKPVLSDDPSQKAPQQKDSFDLFFESVSASVKSLPLKLSYEVKSKISQLLSEFELRALCEKEALERAAQEGTANLAPVLVTPAFEGEDKTIQVTTSLDSTMPHLVYTFQQKTQ